MWCFSLEISCTLTLEIVYRHLDYKRLVDACLHHNIGQQFSVCNHMDMLTKGNFTDCTIKVVKIFLHKIFLLVIVLLHAILCGQYVSDTRLKSYTSLEMWDSFKVSKFTGVKHLGKEFV